MGCYIFRPDGIGQKFIDAMIEPARAGVIVTLTVASPKTKNTGVSIAFSVVSPFSRRGDVQKSRFAIAAGPHRQQRDHGAGGLGSHLALKNRLDKLQGALFDQAYMKAMVDDHVNDVHVFEMEAQTTKASDIKTFVEKTLPTLREHLKMAQDVYKAVS